MGINLLFNLVSGGIGGRRFFRGCVRKISCYF